MCRESVDFVYGKYTPVCRGSVHLYIGQVYTCVLVKCTPVYGQSVHLCVGEVYTCVGEVYTGV